MMPDALARFLTTDPRDAGCERTLARLHVYVDEVVDGLDAGARHPDLAAHLRSCPPCAQDRDALLDAAAR